MKVFVAGATGLIGSRLVELLVERDHEVSGFGRSERAAEELKKRTGAGIGACDVYDPELLRATMSLAEPQVVIHQLTALPRRFERARALEQLAENDRIRVEGTRHLLAAAEALGVERVIAQSIAFAYRPTGEPVVDEDAPLFLDAPAPFGATVAATAEMERQLAEANAVVLRYGQLYGPGTFFADDGQVADQVRAGQLPLVDAGAGVLSFTHVDDAALAAVVALEAPPGTYNIVDDDPIGARDWLSLYARSLDAPEPESIDREAAIDRIGWTWTYRLTEQPGASNSRARERFGWRPEHASWRAELG